VRDIVRVQSNIVCVLARRLEREVKDILDDFSADDSLKCQLFHGKRVDLAEDLSRRSLLVSRID
jgi:hypothetical protein